MAISWALKMEASSQTSMIRLVFKWGNNFLKVSIPKSLESEFSVYWEIGHFLYIIQGEGEKFANFFYVICKQLDLQNVCYCFKICWPHKVSHFQEGFSLISSKTT